MRWEEMPKGHTRLADLVKQFESHCRIEGKPETTCRWYRDILARYLDWAGESCLDEFNLEKVREYLGYLQTRPRYLGHPTTPSNGRTGLHVPAPRGDAARLLTLAQRRGVHTRAPPGAP